MKNQKSSYHIINPEGDIALLQLIPLSLLGNGSVKIPLSLLGNGSVNIPLIVARQRLGRNVTEVTNTHTTVEELLDA
jgi:hypothetical protein